ARHFLPV
ncbi:hypothetical protein VCHC55B2_2677B, partial [Vibrio cholerae HC-55B2]